MVAQGGTKPPEPGSLYAPFATPLERRVAARKDGLLLLLAWLLTVTIALIVENGWLFLASLPGMLPVAIAYEVLCIGGCGQTIGMRLTRLKLVRAEDGGPVGYRRALTRAISGLTTGDRLTYIMHPFKEHRNEPVLGHDRRARTVLVLVPR